jgi:SAM-dependent methyltransferase
MKHEDNPKSIKYYVKRFFYREKDRFRNKKIVDFPAGNGVTSNIIRNIGAIPLPYDLFPEYFNQENLTCTRANINEGIPLKDAEVDAIISQEGIEHFENQLSALQEFNRILKIGGSLIITTPNNSNMVGRLSYFLAENELFNKTMPQNELDDIWMSKQEISKEIYYGHIFLIGINKLRLLAKLSGFKIKNLEKSKPKTTAIILLILFYPFILFSNWRSYSRNVKRNDKYTMETKRRVYGEVFKLAINPRLLINSHIFIEFEKEFNINEVKENLVSQHQIFGDT